MREAGSTGATLCTVTTRDLCWAPQEVKRMPMGVSGGPTGSCFLTYTSPEVIKRSQKCYSFGLPETVWRQLTPNVMVETSAPCARLLGGRRRKREGERAGMGWAQEKRNLWRKGGQSGEKNKRKKKDVEMKSGERERQGLPKHCLPGFESGIAKKERKQATKKEK